MKMNKLVKGLLVGFIALQMVGCEEAKEVENIEVQDTKPVVEEGLNLETRVCEFCGETTYTTLDFVNEEIARQKETIAKTTDIDDKLEMTTYLEKFIAFKGCNNCIKADYEKDTKVEDPVKEEPKEVAHDEDIEPCVICEEFGFKKDMIRMGDGYYDEFCYNEITNVEEEVEATPEIIEKAVSIDNCEACGTTNIEWMTNWDYMCHDCGNCGSVN